jgi:hypothetical protein
LKNVAAFKIWFIPNYKPDESVILFMGHHSLLDGVQFFSAMQTLDKDSDFSKLPRVTPPTWWQNILMNIMSPFAVLREVVKVVGLPIQ